MSKPADRVRDTSTTTGTGTFTLAGVAPLGFQTFAAGLGASAVVVSYTISSAAGEWEVGVGTFNGTTGLTREIVESSSNANALVNFSAGSKDVFVTYSAKSASRNGLGADIGLSNRIYLS